MFNIKSQNAATLPAYSPSIQTGGGDMQMNQIGDMPAPVNIKVTAPVAFNRRQWRKRRVGRYASS